MRPLLLTRIEFKSLFLCDFNELTTFCICEPSVPICKCDIEQQFSYPGKKKYLPTEKEKESNPRSKSAIMRYVVKL